MLWDQSLFNSRILLRVCVAAAICNGLLGCSAKDTYSFPAQDILDSIRNVDLSPRSPAADRHAGAAGQPARPHAWRPAFPAW